MNEVRLRHRTSAALSINMRDADLLLESGDGDAALLYLHILRSGGAADLSLAARELHRSDRDMRRAAEALRQLGLLGEDRVAASVPHPAQELPEYAAEDIISRGMESPAFQDLVAEVQRILGRVLATVELQKLFGIYDDLSLPPDVIMMLVQHCREDYAEHYGSGKIPGFSVIEKEAYIWFNRGITTYDQAEQWLQEHTLRKGLMDSLQKVLGLETLSVTGREYIESWLDMGFSEEALAEGADRTVTKTGRLNWAYMNKILESWHNKGLHTLEEIQKGDRKSKSCSATCDPAPRDDTKALEQMARLREKMKKG